MKKYFNETKHTCVLIYRTYKLIVKIIVENIKISLVYKTKCLIWDCGTWLNNTYNITLGTTFICICIMNLIIISGGNDVPQKLSFSQYIRVWYRNVDSWVWQACKTTVTHGIVCPSKIVYPILHKMKHYSLTFEAQVVNLLICDSACSLPNNIYVMEYVISSPIFISGNMFLQILNSLFYTYLIMIVVIGVSLY